MNETKICKTCERELPLNTDYYFKNCDKQDGFLNVCKECKGRKFTDKLTKIVKDNHKFCIRCDKELPATIQYFPPDKGCTYGVRNVCRECGKDGHYMDDDYKTKHFWTEDEEKLLLEVYPHYTNEEIISKFFPNETRKSLGDKSFKLGSLNKTEETMKRAYKEMKLKVSGEKSYWYGRGLSDETKNKISISRRKLNLKGENSYWYGKKRSEKQRKQIGDRKRAEGNWKGDKNPRHINPLCGELNGRWAGGLKDIKDYLRTVISEWKNESMEYWKYKCAISNGEFDNIHHLYSFTNIINETFDECQLEIKQQIRDYTKEELSLLENTCIDLHRKYGLGICLSKEEHKKFHDKYGYMNTRPEYFIQYLNDIGKQDLIENIVLNILN